MNVKVPSHLGIEMMLMIGEGIIYHLLQRLTSFMTVEVRMG